MKTAFWKADWFLGLVIAIVLFGFARFSGFIPGLERWAYDLGVTGVPTFIVGHNGVVGAQPYDRFKAAVDAALARGAGGRAAVPSNGSAP